MFRFLKKILENIRIKRVWKILNRKDFRALIDNQIFLETHPREDISFSKYIENEVSL